jgi:hypothetical protein
MTAKYMSFGPKSAYATRPLGGFRISGSGESSKTGLNTAQAESGPRVPKRDANSSDLQGTAV